MKDELIALLKETGALITDSHLVGVSGRHMSVYVNKDALIPHTSATSRVGEMFAEQNKDLDIDVVVAPAMGAIILGQWTAYHLSKLKGKEILSVYTDKTGDDDQVLKRGYDKMVAGKNVLCIEDTTTTGGSVKKVAEKVRDAGGMVVGVRVMINRDAKNITSESVGFPFDALATIDADSYAEEECPLCASGVPINTTVGHGKKFLEKKSS
ncbi:MAG TPA: phosphoribosyltransferase family protein [Candidatus Paceibacterota bacterium]|nr:phosphoribosyltransferase family protein [Candidatus Paceibacterota bacterium]